MRQRLAVLLVLSMLCGCGLGTGPSSFVGTWSFTFKVAESTASGTTTRDQVLQLAVTTSPNPGEVTLVLGNCGVPLHVEGSSATLSAAFTCPLTPGATLPLPTTPATEGQILAVSKATFTLGVNDRLAMTLSYHVQANAQHPDTGPTVDFVTNDASSGSRVK